MKKILMVFMGMILSINIFAHSQYLYTDSLDLTGKDSAKIVVLFGHPFISDDKGIDVAVDGDKDTETKEFFVVNKDKKTDLKDKLKRKVIKYNGADNKVLEYDFTQEEGLKGSGTWIFVAVPGPTKDGEHTFSPINKIIVTKEGGGGWEKRVADGYPEIVPLNNPVNAWKENVFRARLVDKDGKPIPNASVYAFNAYIESDLEKGEVKAKAGETKHGYTGIFTDDNGIFSFSPPEAGKWIFSASTKMDFEKKQYEMTSLTVEFE